MTRYSCLRQTPPSVLNPGRRSSIMNVASMAEPANPKAAHQRRPRYRGTHPRRFGEKYKEFAPEKYPELVAQLRERGRTPAGQHVPVLVEEALAVLAPQPGERGVD